MIYSDQLINVITTLGPWAACFFRRILARRRSRRKLISINAIALTSLMFCKQTLYVRWILQEIRVFSLLVFFLPPTVCTRRSYLQTEKGISISTIFACTSFEAIFPVRKWFGVFLLRYDGMSSRMWKKCELQKKRKLPLPRTFLPQHCTFLSVHVLRNNNTKEKRITSPLWDRLPECHAEILSMLFADIFCVW